MKPKQHVLAWLQAIVLSAAAAAQVHAGERDARAVEILKRMDEYKSGLSSFVVKGASSRDARMHGGLIVSNLSEITVHVQRPGSLHYRSFDGVNHRELYLHGGQLAIHNPEKNVYAQEQVPAGVDEGLDFALEEFGIDLPLMDLVQLNSFSRLVEESDTVEFLADKARAMGVDCDQIAIRTEEVDVQLWVQEGDKPIARRIVLTHKWEGGAPRFAVDMTWETGQSFKEGMFVFEPPEGASKIELLKAP